MISSISDKEREHVSNFVSNLIVELLHSATQILKITLAPKFEMGSTAEIFELNKRGGLRIPPCRLIYAKTGRSVKLRIIIYNLRNVNDFTFEIMIYYP